MVRDNREAETEMERRRRRRKAEKLRGLKRRRRRLVLAILAVLFLPIIERFSESEEKYPLRLCGKSFSGEDHWFGR